jgi:two-component system, LytTR family, response regulator
VDYAFHFIFRYNNMNTKKVIIIDDEEAARVLIRQYMTDFRELELVAECENGIEAVSAINRIEPDIVFLDIQMPGLSGFQVLKQIIHIPQIIFTTAYDQFAIKAFDLNAIDYLLKPYTRLRFNQAVSKFLQHQKDNRASLSMLAETANPSLPGFSEKILVEHGNKLISLTVKDIVYLEAVKDYTYIYTEKAKYLSRFGIGIVEQRLNTSEFMRVHRSYIINVNFIQEVHRDVNGMQVVLKNNIVLKVSRTYADNIKKLIY